MSVDITSDGRFFKNINGEVILTVSPINTEECIKIVKNKIILSLEIKIALSKNL